MQDFRALSASERTRLACAEAPVALGVPRQCGKACRGNRAVSDTKSASKPPYRVSLTSANGFNANHARSRPPRRPELFCKTTLFALRSECSMVRAGSHLC